MAKTGQPGVLIFWELFDVLEALSGDEAKNMLSAIRGYVQRGALPNFGGHQTLSFLWLMIQPKLDADSKRYKEIAEKRRIAGRMGGKAKASGAKQTQADLANATFAKQIKPSTTTTTTTATTPTTTKDHLGGKPQHEKNVSYPKRIFGEYKNVLLTDEEFEKLKAEFADYVERIDRLSSYVARTGKTYKSHYATIRNWAKKDIPQTSPQVATAREEDYIKHY